MSYILSAIIGYLLGSIPTGYLVVKKSHGIKLTEVGSKSVGTVNSFRSSNSKMVGIIVLVIDFGKGFLSVYLSKLFFGDVFIYPMIALIFAVFAHCYSPWIKFKGGKGLATAAGGAVLLSIPVLALWLFFFIVGFLFRKNVHFANAASTILTGALCVSTGDILNKWSNPPAETTLMFIITTVIMLSIITIRHIEPVKEYYKNQKLNIGKDKK